MRKVNIDRLIIAILLISVIAVSFSFNLKHLYGSVMDCKRQLLARLNSGILKRGTCAEETEAERALSQKTDTEADHVAIFRQEWGYMALLGTLLYELYPHKTTFTAKRAFYMILPIEVYSYPIRIRYDANFKSGLERDEFDFLKSKALYSISAHESNKIQYYFLEAPEKEEEMGLFIYQSNIVVAPMKWNDVRDR